MSLITKTIPSFTGGVSQQTPSVRQETQCEMMDNCYPSLVKGLIKRPPLEHVVNLTTNAATDTLVHPINRDSNERYQVIFTGDEEDPVEIFKLDGTKCTVRYGDLDENLVYTERTAVKSYFTTTNPMQNIRATTVADYTIVTNKEINTTMSDEVTGTWINEALLYVKRGAASTNYRVWLNGFKVADYESSTTSSPLTYRTSVIAADLYSDIVAATNSSLRITVNKISTVTTQLGSTTYPSHGFTVTLDGTLRATVQDWNSSDTNGAKSLETQLKNNLTQAWTITRIGTTVYVRKTDFSSFTNSVAKISGKTEGGYSAVQPTGTPEWMVEYTPDTSVIKIKRYDGSDFGFKVEDTYDGNSLIGIKEYVQTMQNLPPNGFEGFTCQIIGNVNEKTDDFWVNFDTDGGKKTGVWKECVKPGSKGTFDKDTMPHRLVRTSEDTFSVSPCIWDKRDAGDDITASPPSFIGKGIGDIFFYRNRLGLLSGENCILSRSGEFFDFWPTTITDILDDDPIDVAVSSNQVAVLNYAVPFAKNLALFGSQLQFNLGSGDNNLTPKTIAIDPTTYYTTSDICKPVGVGDSIYFPSPKGRYSAIREYFVDPNTLINEAADVTAHVPEFIPSDVIQMTGNDALSTVFAICKSEPGTIYGYKYYWAGDEKKQSAWFKWNFNFNIIGITTLDSLLYIVYQKDETVSLGRIDLEGKVSGSLEFDVHLDFRRTVTGSYSSQNDLTTWTLPRKLQGDKVIVVDSVSGVQLSNVNCDGEVVTKSGNYSSIPVYVGEKYLTQFRFSPLTLKVKDTNVEDLGLKVKYRSITIGYQGTGYFQVSWQTPFRDPEIHTFTGIVLGAAYLGEQHLY